IGDGGVPDDGDEEPLPDAESFRYLRFWIDSTSDDPDPMQLRELRWLSGDRELPFASITNATGDEDVELMTTTGNLFAWDGPWKLFDDDENSHWYVTAGNELTLYFKNIEVYPTGIRLTSPGWSQVAGFTAEGSNDGE